MESNFFKEIRDVLEVLSFAAQIISFPVAAVSIILARREANASRNIQIALTLSESFRKYWESGWADFLQATANQNIEAGDDFSDEQIRQIRFMLNWIDWLGVFIQTKHFSNPQIVLGSISGRLREIITLGRSIIADDTARYGADYWSGVNRVSMLLGMASPTPASDVS
jgi:hypothetical protein